MEDLSTEPVAQFMTVREAAQRLNVSERAIRRYINDPQNPLPAVYLANKRTIRIPWEQFNLWLDSKKEGGE